MKTTTLEVWSTRTNELLAVVTDVPVKFAVKRTMDLYAEFIGYWPAIFDTEDEVFGAFGGDYV